MSRPRTLNRELGVSHNLIHQRFGSKQQLWRATVDWAFGRLAAEVGFEVDESADPLDQLRAAVRGFLLFSARHPDLLRLMNTESGLDSGRLDYLFETYVREIPASTLFFLLAHGAAAPFSNEPLARRFGDTVDAQRHADLVADLLVAGLRT